MATTPRPLTDIQRVVIDHLCREGLLCLEDPRDIGYNAFMIATSSTVIIFPNEVEIRIGHHIKKFPYDEPDFFPKVEAAIRAIRA